MAGINATIKNYNSDEDLTMLTKQDVMDLLHIKDPRRFSDLINKQHLPHIKIGSQYLIPLQEYKKWIKNMTEK